MIGRHRIAIVAGIRERDLADLARLHVSLDREPAPHANDHAVDVVRRHLDDGLTVRDEAVARRAQHPAARHHAVDGERTGIVRGRAAVVAKSVGRAHRDRSRRAGVVDDGAADRRTRADEDDDAGLLLRDAERDAHGRSRAERAAACRQRIGTRPQAGEPKPAIAIGDHDLLARLGELERGGVVLRSDRGAGDGLPRVRISHDALDRAARHEREARRRAIDVARLRRVFGMARSDEERAASDRELVAAAGIGERDGDGAPGLRAGIESRGVDAGARDHAAARVGDRPGQRPATRGEHERDACIAVHVERLRRWFVAIGGRGERPLTGGELDRDGAIARGPGDDDRAIGRRAAYDRAGDRPGCVAHRDDNACRGRAGHRRRWLARHHRRARGRRRALGGRCAGQREHHHGRRCCQQNDCNHDDNQLGRLRHVQTSLREREHCGRPPLAVGGGIQPGA